MQQQEQNQSFSSYHKIVLLLLALLQFAVILDFMIIAPIGDVLMKSLDISTEQFGLVVSSYAFSAAISGVVIAGFSDQYGRKRLLQFVLLGFIAGTLFCGLASTYTQMLLARIVTGIFAGVTSATLLTIISDLFATQMRGRAMAAIQMGFGFSQVIGIPLGIFICNHLGWNNTFIFIVLLASAIFVAISLLFEPMEDHLGLQRDSNAFVHLWHTLTNKHYQTGFIAVAFLTIGGFMLMPFTSIFLVNNVHISNQQLPLIFLATGLSSLVFMPVIGKLSDKFDRFKIFTIGSLMATVMVMIYTHLSVTPLWLMLLINVVMFAAILSRNSPVMALNTMVPKPQDRGAYMSISASLQQTAGGIASVIAGLIVYQAPSDHHLINFDILGYVTVSVFLTCIFLVRRVDSQLKQQPI